MSCPKTHKKAGNKKKKVVHAEILTGSLHKSQLEAPEVVTSKTHYKLALEAHQARTKKPKRKRSPTNSCTEPQGTRIVTVMETLPVITWIVPLKIRYVHNATNGICYPYGGNGSSVINAIHGCMLHALELVKGWGYANVICVKLSIRLLSIMLLSAHCNSERLL